MWSQGELSRSQRAHCAWAACVTSPPVLTLFLFLQSGGGSVPPMKVVTLGTSRLKAAQGQAGSPDKGKHGKQRAEYMRIQAQQQVSLGTTGAGPGPHPDALPLPLPTGSAVCSCCVLAISCQYSCDHLPAGCPERSSLPGLPHRSLKPSSPSSLQSQGSGSGSQPDGSSLRRPLTQDQRGLSPQPLLDKTPLRLVTPGCGRGLYARLPATPLPSSASFPLLSSPTCSLGSPLSSQPPS